MSKRGETRPYRVEYEWSNGVKGVDTYATLDVAEMMAQKIVDAAAYREDITVSVAIRDRRTT